MRVGAYYGEHFSILLDLGFLLRSVGVMMWGDDRYVEKALVAGETKTGKGQSRLLSGNSLVLRHVIG